MGTKTTYEDRKAMVAGAALGERARTTAQRLQVQTSTVHKWRQAYARGGDEALRLTMGRPATGAMSTLGEGMQARIRQMRTLHPGWGAVTLHVELERERSEGERLPSVATIGRFLKAERRTQTPEPHRAMPATTRQRAEAAHECWQMDARGYGAIPDVGIVTLININDCHSHVRLHSYPCRLGAAHVSRHAATEDYQWALRLAFMHWGMPSTLQVDHESVFFDNRTRSPFPTRLHLWLIALGIRLTFSRIHQPKDQGLTERSHQIWERQVLAGQTFPDWQALYHALNQRREVLNNELPCRTLNNCPPLVAFPEARHSGRFYNPGNEFHLLNMHAVHEYLAQGEWFRRIASNGTISLGRTVYYLGANLPRDFVRVTYAPDTHLLLVYKTDGQLLTTTEIQNLSPEILAGNLEHFHGLPARQSPLPFTWHEQQLLRLNELVNVL
jgi:transposase